MKDTPKRFNLYVVYDRVLCMSSRISYALSDVEAYNFCRSQILDTVEKSKGEYQFDDFEVICVGSMDSSTGLITPDYRKIESAEIDSYIKKRKEERQKEYDEIRSRFL